MLHFSFVTLEGTSLRRSRSFDVFCFKINGVSWLCRWEREPSNWV